MHHKRRRPKNRRGGCLMCKSWKVNGAKHQHLPRQRQRARINEREQRIVCRSLDD